ncbi:MAG: InlB B-repeat-containing protein [Bacteroidales bacterium]|nr:InlB B-repeat-containing protein [Candidatus Colicola faecequi]
MKKLFLFLTMAMLCLSMADAKIKVHTIGDSTMADYDESTTDKRGWCQYLQSFFDADTVIINNRGKSGADTRQFYTSSNLWPSVKSQMSAGDYLLIQFAHNDEGTVTYGTDNLELAAYNAANGQPALTDARGTNPQTTFRDYLRLYIDEARALGVTPVLVGPICRKYFSGNTLRRNGQHDLGDKFWKIENGQLLKDQSLPTSDHSMDYVEAMRIVAQEKNVVFVDLTAATRDLYLQYGEAACTADLFCDGDNTHLQTMGANVIGRLGAQLLQDAGVLASFINVPNELTAAPASLDMGETYSGVQIMKEVLVTGFGLTPAAGNITISASANLQVSTDRAAYASTATAAYTSGNIFQRIYVKAQYTSSGTKADTIVITDGTTTLRVPVTANVISLEGGTPVSATWAIVDKATATNATLVGPATAQMTMLNMMAADTKTDFNDNGTQVTLVRLHNSDATNAKVAWPAGEIDENVNRYVDFALTAPNNAEIRITGISMKMASYSTATMNCHVNIGISDNMTGVQTICEKKNMTNMNVYTETFTPTITIPAGDVLHVRVLPWHESASAASGKYIALKDVVIEGMAFETAVVEKFDVTFVTNGHGTAPAAVESLYMPNPLPEMAEEGWIFGGWYTDSTFTTAAVAGEALTADVTLYAKWTVRPTFTVTFDNNGHGTAPEAITVYELPATLPVLAEEGWRFDGWFTDTAFTAAAQAGAAVTESMTLYAKWFELTVPSGEVREEKLYFTNFQDWEAVTSATTVSTKTVETQKSGESLTFSFAETQIAPTGTNTKFTNSEVITAGYAMAAKTATPYIETSALASITKVSYVHAATGSSRGWGLQAKGDGDADWVTLHSATCAQAGELVTVDVNRTNCQLRWYNLNSSQNAYMTELTIYGNVTVTPRTFQDFEIDLTQDPYIVPAGVTDAGYSNHGKSFNGAQHGWMWVAFGFKVDGPVKVTLGGCQYINDGYEGYVVSGISGDVLGQINNKTPNCYHQDGSVATWLYNVEAEDSLVVYCGQYCPYIKVEACDYVPNVTVTYFDQANNRLGEEEVAPGTPFAPEAWTLMLPPVGMHVAFRGWFTNVGKKVREGDPINADTKVYAHVTPIEEALTGTHYKYMLSDATFYPEDHECISSEGAWHDGQHGWALSSGQKLRLAVSDKAYISVGCCQYSAEADVTVTKQDGTAVTAFPAKVATDGSVASFFYDGGADTLEFTMGGTTYIHSVEIYNVANELYRDEATGYYIMQPGDGASLMMLLGQLKKGDKVFLPNGVYDFGEVALTNISADSVSIIGESMEGTIIKNHPAVEGIGVTATILLTGKHCYFQDLTLQCYATGTAAAARGVALQDKGTGSIFKNVFLQGTQDTYYSNGAQGMKAYFETGRIEGTVDFICGSGTVYFNKMQLGVVSRSSANVICAPNTKAGEQYGYVFESCQVDAAADQVGKYNLCRPWNDSPAATWLNTTLLQNGSAAGYTQMTNGLKLRFHEFNTKDADGNAVTGHNLNACSGSAESEELYLDAAGAAAYSYENVLGEWNPKADALQVEFLQLQPGFGATMNGYTGEPTAYAVYDEQDGEFKLVGIVKDFNDINPTDEPAVFRHVRAANGRGGFGPMLEIGGTIDNALENTGATSVRKYMLDGQIIIEKNGVKYNAMGIRM